MKTLSITLFSVLLLTVSLFAQPKSEARAVWVTTVYNLDWPKASGANNQKNEMIALLNKMQALNMNMMFLQVRGRGDVIYPSAIEPWGEPLTGMLGNDPGYDPLKFAIEEGHKRGIEVHAWWNVFKVYGTGTPSTTSPNHIVNKRRDLCRVYANEWWMDPGYPDTRTYLVNLGMEMVRKYDLDGIHFDFIRYPNPDFVDTNAYRLYGNGQLKADWRRANVTQFVFAIYDSIMAIKPWVKVGSAPIGIYKNISSCNSGWESFNDIYQDSRRWLLGRKHDYLSPQIYWRLTTCPRFDSMTIDWSKNMYGRHIYPGINIAGLYSPDNWPASEITSEIDTARKYGTQGQTFFRWGPFTDNTKGIYTTLQAGQFKYPANIPAMSWKDAIPQNPPQAVTIITTDSLNFTLRWNKPATPSDNDTVAYYHIYRSDVNPVNIADVKNIVKFKLRDTSAVITFTSKPNKNYYFVVTAYDRLHNESAPSNTAGIIVLDAKENYQPFTLQLENYPNPFNPETKIRYTLSERSDISIRIYSVLGKEIAVLYKGEAENGQHELSFNPAQYNLPSGVYTCVLQTAKNSLTRKIVYLR